MSLRRPSWTEALLLVLLGVVLAVLFTRGGDLGAQRAYAGGGGTGGIVAITGHQDENTGVLYLVDTRRQRVCVYRWLNPGLRLVAARAYDFDMEILDSSGDRTIESGRGASRGYVKTQVEAARRARELKPLKK